MALEEVRIRPLPPEALEAIIGPERGAGFEATAASMRRLLEGRMVLNVNSTATGGGVAELLQTLLAYAVARASMPAGSSSRAIRASSPSPSASTTTCTARPATAARSGPRSIARYEETIGRERGAPGRARPARRRRAAARPADRRAGPAAPRRGRQRRVALPRRHRHAERALADRGGSSCVRISSDVPAFVFSREQFAPPWVPRDRLAVIPPSIDPFSAKNEAMSDGRVAPLLQHVGLLAGEPGHPPPTFTRRDGSPGPITRQVDLLGTGPPPAAGGAARAAGLALGRVEGHAGRDERHSPSTWPTWADAHLVLAGPSVERRRRRSRGGRGARRLPSRCGRSCPMPSRRRIHSSACR